MFPESPDSSHRALYNAWRKLPVMSWSCLLNFRILWIWVINCSVERFRMFRTPHCHGPCTMAHGNNPTNPSTGSPADRMGFIMLLHCCLVKVMATSRYSNFWRMTCQSSNSAVECVTLAKASKVYQAWATSVRYATSSWLFCLECWGIHHVSIWPLKVPVAGLL